jgi:hypothetical protein
MTENVIKKEALQSWEVVSKAKSVPKSKISFFQKHFHFTRRYLHTAHRGAGDLTRLSYKFFGELS